MVLSCVTPATGRPASFSDHRGVRPIRKTTAVLSTRVVRRVLFFSAMSSNQFTSSSYAPGNPAAVSPTAQRPNSVSVQGFRISTQKRPILKAEPIEEMTKKLGIAPPEMIFGDNYVTIEHEKSKWGITFNAFDALDRVDKTGSSMLKVAYSKEWQQSR